VSIPLCQLPPHLPLSNFKKKEQEHPHKEVARHVLKKGGSGGGGREGVPVSVVKAMAATMGAEQSEVCHITPSYL